MKSVWKIVLILVLIIAWSNADAQQHVQVIKGNIYDAGSRMPLPGATVIVAATDPIIGTTSDANGDFRMENVPLGRHEIIVDFIGYERYVLSELVVGSGKEIMLEIPLTEKYTNLKTVEIKSGDTFDESINPMAISGTQQISMEQASRIAGSGDDPSRLVSSFAGVSNSGLASNGIVVRGNAPKGLLWLLEGVEIFNPNHFADLQTFGGGGLTALSSQMIARSEFMTGAFPANYYNALSGIFDMRLRSGNPDVREHAFSLGTNGIDFSSEGPFVKGKKPTYLFNYRYSTLTLLEPILPPEAGKINYQDFSAKMVFPTKKAGVFSIWMFALRDFQHRDYEPDTTAWESITDSENYKSAAFSGSGGISHRKQLNSKSYLSTVAAFSVNDLSLVEDRYFTNNSLIPQSDYSLRNQRYMLNSFINTKFSGRHLNRTGISLMVLQTDLDIQGNVNGSFMSLSSFTGSAMQVSAFSSSRFRLAENSTLIVGVNGLYNELNEEFIVEPRLSFRQEFGGIHAISLAAGLHSRQEPLTMYYYKNSEGLYPNLNLPLTKAAHMVMSYDRILNENLKLSAGVYYQYLYDVPVHRSFSMINAEQVWLLDDTLNSSGQGRNYGLELSLERKLAKGWYFMLNSAVFRSEYYAEDEIWRHSAYDRKFTLNALGGKEWSCGKAKQNLFSINGRLSWSGGMYFTPPDIDESLTAGMLIDDEARIYAEQAPDMAVLSMSVNYRKNKKNHSSIWTMQVINLLSAAEFMGYEYDELNNKVSVRKDAFFMPSVAYKIEF